MKHDAGQSVTNMSFIHLSFFSNSFWFLKKLFTFTAQFWTKQIV